MMYFHKMYCKTTNLRKFSVLVSLALLTACGGVVTKPEAKSPSPPGATPADSTSTKAGGYYLDDGPGENAPTNIDAIADAQPKVEVPLERANKPYSALGMQYKPLINYVPYKKQGMASWYGKRYHGKQTSSGEVYDMYGMTAAHTTLPIPSYARVTNPANGNSVIVRINDRGPFKHDRIIDLSYAAAYKLRLAEQGSALVEVEMLDTRSNGSIAKIIRKAPAKTETANTTTENTNVEKVAVVAPTKMAAPDEPAVTSPVEVEPVVSAEPTQPAPVTSAPPSPPIESMPPTKPSVVENPVTPNSTKTTSMPMSKKAGSSSAQYYVQAGAFKSEANSQSLQKKILSLPVAKNVGVDSVYNNGLYLVKLGPYASRKDAEVAASNIRKQLGTAAIVKN